MPTTPGCHYGRGSPCLAALPAQASYASKRQSLPTRMETPCESGREGFELGMCCLRSEIRFLSPEGGRKGQQVDHRFSGYRSWAVMAAMAATTVGLSS